MAVAEARRWLPHHAEACSCTVVGGLAQEGRPCSALGQIVSQFRTRAETRAGVQSQWGAWMGWCISPFKTHWHRRGWYWVSLVSRLESNLDPLESASNGDGKDMHGEATLSLTASGAMGGPWAMGVSMGGARGFGWGHGLWTLGGE